MNRMLFVCVAVLAWPTAFVSRAVHAIEVEGFVVKVIDEVDVPAIETGTLQVVGVREGDRVLKGQVLGKLDDRQARMNARLAATELEIAKKRSKEFTSHSLAEKNLAEQLQMAAQHELLKDISHRKATNEVRVLAARKAEEVARNELARAGKAREKFIDSVSKSELEGLRLSYEHSQLETQQASFDRSIDLLTAKSEDKAAELFAIRVDQAKIELKQASSDRDVVGLQADARDHAYQITQDRIARHEIIAPFDGVVVQRHRQVGHWVKPGDPIVRIIRMNRLRAEGLVQADTAAKLRSLKQVSLITQVDGKSIVRRGDVVFVSVEVDPVSRNVRVLVEFDNADEDILPGSLIRVSTE